jgi:hypothetical protein
MRFAAPHEPCPVLVTIQALVPLGNEKRRRCALTESMQSRGIPYAASGFDGARISAWRHFKGCRADIFRGYHGGLSCRSSLIPRAVITFLVGGIG